MRKYLDPVYLAISEEAWNSRTYAEIFDSLNTLLTRIEKVEKSTGTLYQLVKFKLTEGLFSLIYSNNPFKNDPEIQEFYTKLFKDRILPELFRRTEWCPSLCTILEENSQNCRCSYAKCSSGFRRWRYFRNYFKNRLRFFRC